mmetsp:Transcript_8681/g.28555  ORF Transcript_8681/g.28555 Transcript_8681/m.28555 type:complete len:255 (-) Transcript_8681:23-787(-)
MSNADVMNDVHERAAELQKAKARERRASNLSKVGGLQSHQMNRRASLSDPATLEDEIHKHSAAAHYAIYDGQGNDRHPANAHDAAEVGNLEALRVGPSHPLFPPGPRLLFSRSRLGVVTVSPCPPLPPPFTRFVGQLLLIHSRHLNLPPLTAPLPHALQSIVQQGGFHVDEYDRFGRTALMIAAEQGHTQICEELMHLGANVLVRGGACTSTLAPKLSFPTADSPDRAKDAGRPGPHAPSERPDPAPMPPLNPP